MTAEANSAASGERPQRRGGPHTPGGKRRAARNSFRHGLSLSIGGDPALCARAERLAVAIAGKDPSLERLEQCRIFAHAQVDMWRVRLARAALIDLAAARNGGSDAPPDAQRDGAALLAAWPQLVRLERYERRAHSRRDRAARLLDFLQ